MNIIQKKLLPALSIIAAVARHPLFHYSVLVVLSSAVLLYRSSALITYPSFYAEDGSIFFQNINDDGILRAIFTPFNGYFISGLYILAGVAGAINALIGGSLFSLAALYSLVSVVFMAAVICLPYVLFRRQFGAGATLLTVALSTLMPLYQSSFIVIGTVGNQKFLFTYLAFLLILFRLFNYRVLTVRSIIAIDLLLLVCAYTNSTTYLLLPALILPYVRILLSKRPKFKALKSIIRMPSFLSATGLLALVVPQVLMVVIKGIPKLPGYLDSPFRMERFIEIFINRTVLYGATHPFNAMLGDLRVTVLFIALIAAAIYSLRGARLFTFFAGMYTALATSILFVYNRTGVSDFFTGYTNFRGGPDQFFYAQTLVMYLPLAILLFALMARIRHRGLRLTLTTAACMTVFLLHLVPAVNTTRLIRTAETYQNNNFSLLDQAIILCAKTGGDKISLNAVTPVGPSDAFIMKVDRSSTCADTKGRHPSVARTELNKNISSQVAIDDTFTPFQLFTANYDNLSGIQLLVSTYGKERRAGNYSFVLYESDCRTKLANTDMPSFSLDNSYQRLHFAPIQDSSGKTYCFSVQQPANTYDPIALSLSGPNKYTPILYINGAASKYDFVFDTIYKY